MSRFDKQTTDWQPEGITLEPSALEVVKSLVNTLVVAGPGAGKTELLAQRACFLLQTGTCPPPYRILAISFKREAAENLRARVLLRCGRELAARFDSMTYDAFGKDLLDRFRLSLPNEYRPSPNYNIITGVGASNDRLLEEFMGLPSDQCSLDESTRRSITGLALVRDGLLGYPLPHNSWPQHINYIAGQSLWRAMIRAHPSRLTFPMIGRLAEFIVSENKHILRAFQETYKFVFLDEFQDTTNIQFALTKACFLESSSVLTAVGDTKQKIMGWAGALRGIFKHFETSFHAEIAYLTQNHRSRSKLVAVQAIFAKELDPESVPVTSSRTGDAPGECRVLEFENEIQEAKSLTELIEQAIKTEQVPPEEICILCRARPDRFAKALINALSVKNIKTLVDTNRRDIINEQISLVLLDFISLIIGSSEPEAWENVNALMANLSGNYNDQPAVLVMRQLSAFLVVQKEKIPPPDKTNQKIEQMLQECLNFLGRDRFAVLHPQYAQGDYLETVVEKLADLIGRELPTSGWEKVVQAVKGVGAVSIMTMHKSKGLEFHTVIFLGLEDDAIWNYKQNSDEETCGLFVALSRAKERCVFTYCRNRPNHNGSPTKQSRISIKRIFELFAAAGVNVETVA